MVYFYKRETDLSRTRDRPAVHSHAGLERLSGPHREVLTLRFLHEMTYEEIAEVAQVGLGTVRSRLHHAKRALRRQLKDMTSTSLKGARR